MIVEVRNSSELKAAMENGASEILVTDMGLAKRLKAVRAVKRMGPVAIGGVIAAIPFIVSTGGTGSVAIAAFVPSSAWTGVAIAGLAVAVGGTIAISLFTDWDYVELPMGIKMARRGGKPS